MPVAVVTRPGTAWQSRQRAVPWSGVCPLKWHNVQVEGVTAMCEPTMTCEWHDVQRSRMPLRLSVRCGVWSKITPWKSTLPSSSRRSWQRRQLASSTSAHGLVP